MEDKSKENKGETVIFIVITIIYFIGVVYEISYILNMFYIPLCIISFILIKIKYNALFKEVKDYEYYRDIDFKKISATASGIILGTEKVNVNTVITAIYELAEKKVVSLKFKENRNYLKLEEHKKENIKKLLPYEKEIIKFIFEGIEDTKEYCLEEILDSAKNNANQNYILKNIEKEIKNYINEKYFLIDLRFLKGMTFAKAMLVGIIPLFIFGTFSSLLSIFILDEIIAKISVVQWIMIVILFIAYMKTKFIKLEYHEEAKKLYGLYQYMSDYSLLHEQEVKFYQLYNSYYVYAMGMGLADKFEDELGQDELNNEVRTALQFYLQNRRKI
ncbi:MAG: DUF2207 domain-containing protein [Clostridia bacterium]|jgi:uncharacterized membrane protein|nr:DUF2207 domain-containing protein [Clostridia bacterium]